MTSDKDSGGNFCESELIPCKGSNDVMNQNSKNKSREEHPCLLTKNISNLDGQGQKKKDYRRADFHYCLWVSAKAARE